MKRYYLKLNTNKRLATDKLQRAYYFLKSNNFKSARVRVFYAKDSTNEGIYQNATEAISAIQAFNQVN